MIFKSMANAAFEVTGFFDLCEGCSPCIIKILLMGIYLPLIATFKPHASSHANDTLAPAFRYFCHTVRMHSNHSITGNPEQSKGTTTQSSSQCYKENHQNKMQNHVRKNKSLSLIWPHSWTPLSSFETFCIIKCDGMLSKHIFIFSESSTMQKYFFL